MEQACMLCNRAEADPDLYGHKLQKEELCAHSFCLFFANGLLQQGSRDGVPLEEVRRTINRAARKKCFVCGRNGATITCREPGCNRSFHLPCATEGGCVTQFFGLYRSFCWEHRPEQTVEAVPEKNTTCLICLDPVEDRKSYRTIVCPACKHAWFHRHCIQKHAMHAGTHCFSCPQCQNEYRFRMEMLTIGIKIPDRGPSWQIDGAYEELYEKHICCDARECLCPGGRDQAEKEGPWQLLLCRSCAAEGTHRRCSSLQLYRSTWECDGCAGLATGSSAISETSSPSTDSQSGLGPSHGSPAPETSSPGTESQVALESSCGSPGLQDSSRSSPPGPDRVRNRSRLQRRAQIPYRRPRRCRENNQTPAPRAESSRPRQAALELSHSSPGQESSSVPAETSSPSNAGPGLPYGSPGLRDSSRSSLPGPDRTRNRSRLQRQAQNPYRRPRRCRESSQTPKLKVESSRPRQAALGSSHSSPAPETSSLNTSSCAALQHIHDSAPAETSSPSNAGSGLSCGSPGLRDSSCSSPAGPDRVRNRSRLQRRAQNPYRRPRRCHESSQTPELKVESSSPRQAALGLSHSSPAPKTSSLNTSSCAALQHIHDSAPAETSSPSNAGSGLSCGSPGLRDSSCSSPAGPNCTRNRSRLPSNSSPEQETSSPSTTRQLPSSCGSPAPESGGNSSPTGPKQM